MSASVRRFRDRRVSGAERVVSKETRNEALRLAVRVIERSSREHPADAILRQELAALPAGSPTQKRLTSRAVFAYYRWRGWLQGGPATVEQLNQAMELADRYRQASETFQDSEILERALPAWLRAELELTPSRARGLQLEPRLWLRARPGQGKALARSLGHCRLQEIGPMRDSLEYLGSQDLFCSAEFHQGLFELQDLSSQAVGWVCAPLPSQTWWDACAGDGGKTLHFSDLMTNKGLIWATDRASWRLRRLKTRAARARSFNFRTAAWDGGAKLPTKTKFDGVLVDAPCSGVGTWQRNPHARWTTSPEDVRELRGVQERLLGHVAGAVKLGGKLVYAVCTLTRAETEVVACEFEKKFPEFERMLLGNPLDPNLPAAREVKIWPGEFGSNGMFIAGWRRCAG